MILKVGFVAACLVALALTFGLRYIEEYDSPANIQKRTLKEQEEKLNAERIMERRNRIRMAVAWENIWYGSGAQTDEDKIEVLREKIKELKHDK